MGLGKSVELIATILSNRFQGAFEQVSFTIHILGSLILNHSSFADMRQMQHRHPIYLRKSVCAHVACLCTRMDDAVLRALMQARAAHFFRRKRALPKSACLSVSSAVVGWLLTWMVMKVGVHLCVAVVVYVSMFVRVLKQLLDE